jgi:hypothetical protein
MGARHRHSAGPWKRIGRRATLIGAVACAGLGAWAVPAFAAHNVYRHGPWTITETPYSFTSRMYIGGGYPFENYYTILYDHPHSGGFRMMRCDGTTAISTYKDFAAHDVNTHVFATNVAAGTCYRARGYSALGNQTLYIDFDG